MDIQVEIWQLVTLSVTLLVAFFAGLGGLFKVLYGQLDKRLASMDHARSDDMTKFKQLLSDYSATTDRRIDVLSSDLNHYRCIQGERWEKIGDRAARLEQQQAAAIGHQDLSHLHDRINALTANLTKELGQLHSEVTAQNAQIVATAALLRTIDQYLRDQAHRAGDHD